jgi:phage recombination protein Bet
METTIQKVSMSQTDIDSLTQAGIIPKGTPPEQVAIFASVCRERNLSPFSKQIYLIPRGGKYTIQTSIDGLRVIAERTGKYVASSDYSFNEGKTQFEMLKEGLKIPITATVTVTKANGHTGTFTATVNWDSYYPGDSLGHLWKKFPFLMLGKCAEALALRKAFPEAIGNIYIEEEMQQSEMVIEPQKIETVKVELSDTVKEMINGFANVDALMNWSKNQTHLHTNEDFRNMVKEKRTELTKGVAL